MQFEDFQVFQDKVDLLGYDLVNTCIKNNMAGLLDDILEWRMRDEDEIYMHWVVELTQGYMYIKGPRYRHMHVVKPLFSQVYLYIKDAMDVYDYHTGRKFLP